MTEERFNREWAHTEDNLKAINMVMNKLCEVKPSSKAPAAEIAMWENRIKPYRDLAVQFGEYRYQLLIERNKGNKK